MATATSLLAQIDAAIEALLIGGAASYNIGSRSVTSLDLPTLFEQRRMLQLESDRESGDGSMFRVAKMQRARQ
jgi:hypothetical protein